MKTFEIETKRLIAANFNRNSFKLTPLQAITRKGGEPWYHFGLAMAQGSFDSHQPSCPAFCQFAKKEATEKEVPSLVGAMGKYNDILSPSNIL